MKKIIMILAMCGASVALYAQSVRITQVDTGSLLIKGQIDSYVSLSGVSEKVLQEIGSEAFRATELIDKERRQLEIVDVTYETAKMNGIDFLLLIDNSGSMYDAATQEEARIVNAREALTHFLTSVDGSGDRVAMAAFNTFLQPLARLGSSTGVLRRSLGRISEPEREASYTELYMTLDRSLSEIASASGRKAVIVLSDGENYPFSQFSGMDHPLWGGALLTPDDVVRRYREEGITLYAVNFADRPDPNLSRMALETGGSVFEARTSSGLMDVYTRIRDTIRREVRVRVKVPAAPSAERNLTITYENFDDEAVYFAPLLLSIPGNIPWFVPLLVILAAVAVLVALHMAGFEKAVGRPEIQAIGEGMAVTLRDEVTVIGSAPDDHLTLSGNPGIDHHHATVIHDGQKGTFTLVSERPVRVNNTPVKKRTLKPGDVIGIEGTTLVFDTPPVGDGINDT
jgi:Ca-activated chloride channel homolog